MQQSIKVAKAHVFMSQRTQTILGKRQFFCQIADSQSGSAVDVFIFRE
jgi:hypothetical protein